LRDGEKIAHPWITNALAKAQQKVESRNFDMRKNLLKFDNIMNDQRKVIYEQRREIMAANDVSGTINDLREEVINTLVTHAIPPHSYVEQWDLQGLQERVKEILALDLPILEWGKENGVTELEIEQRIRKAAEDKIAEKMKMINEDSMRRAEKAALLGVLDQSWKDHLLALDQLRQGIHLRGYGQRDPLNEYSREAFGLFQLMLNDIREQVIKALMHTEVRLPSLEDIMARSQIAMQELHGTAADAISPSPFGSEPHRRLCQRATRKRLCKTCSMRRIRLPGAKPRATRRVLAVRAKNTSIAMGRQIRVQGPVTSNQGKTL
jgi:preprotein translocase subunit SecA